VPIQKFRSAEAMQATPGEAKTASDFDRFLRHCARFRSMAQKTYPRGVFKFRSVADANEARARYDSSPSARTAASTRAARAT
jgi:hypothetical protein